MQPALDMAGDIGGALSLTDIGLILAVVAPIATASVWVIKLLQDATLTKALSQLEQRLDERFMPRGELAATLHGIKREVQRVHSPPSVETLQNILPRIQEMHISQERREKEMLKALTLIAKQLESR